MRACLYVLLSWSLVRPADAGVEALRLPVDSSWREYIRASGGTGESWTVYPLGKAPGPSRAQQLRNRIALRLDDATEASAISMDYHLAAMGPARGTGDSGWWIFEGASPAALVAQGPLLMQDPRLTGVHVLLYRQQSRRLVPNDPQFPQQWYLQNTGQGGGRAGLDLNLIPAWDRVRGKGIRLAIVDDGLQLTHPDLLPNVDTGNDHDWNDSTPDDPSPDPSRDFHGTACAGVAAACGNNQLGISGTAPEATLVGLRLIAGPSSDAEEAEALAWRPQVIDIYSNSWGPDDDGRTLEEPGPLARAALKNGTATGRNNKGSIFLFAAGNGRAEKDDSNYDGYANSIYTITVAALGNNGGASLYSEPGANILITAPSSGGTRDVVTTDLTGANGRNQSGSGGNLADIDYTNTFSGTSAACPMVAGCVALLLEANPALGWRDVQEILIRSARKVNPSDPGWMSNAAGLSFHHDYGAGLLDADAAVKLALTWQPRAAATTVTSEETVIALPVPDDSSAGLTRTFQINHSQFVTEHVTLRVDLRHANRGQLNITLTSPSGTISRLASQHFDSGDHYLDWTFSTVHCWGENPAGVWTLHISDTVGGTAGTYRSSVLTIHGTITAPVNQPPVITGGAIAPERGAFTDMSLVLTGVTSRDPEGDPVTLAYQWQNSSDGMLWVDLPAASASTLDLAGVGSGTLVRCRLRASAGGLVSGDWLTAAVAVNRRPIQYARRGRAYLYDSDLFLNGTTLTRDVIVHEFSQGPAGGTSEWIELLVVKPSDLRGWQVGDKAGGYVTFAQAGLWSRIAAGTLIVIYRGPARDQLVPAAFDDDPTDFRLILPHDNVAYFAMGATWGGISNTAAESLILTRADGSIADGIAFNTDSTQQPSLTAVGSANSARFTGGKDTDADLPAFWLIAGQATATPGMANDASGSPNAIFLDGLRSGALPEKPRYRFAPPAMAPAGLRLHPDTGVLDGMVDVPAGIYPVSLERFAADGQVAAQSWLLYVTDPASDLDDPDNDSMNNLTEIAFGLDPNQASIPPAGLLQSDGAWSWFLTLPAAFTTPGHPSYTLEHSADLKTWTQLNNSIGENRLISATTRLLSLRWGFPGGFGRGYVRLRAAFP